MPDPGTSAQPPARTPSGFRATLSALEALPERTRALPLLRLSVLEGGTVARAALAAMLDSLEPEAALTALELFPSLGPEERRVLLSRREELLQRSASLAARAGRAARAGLCAFA